MSEVKPSQNIAQFIELLKSRDFNYSPSANPTPIVSIISSFFNEYKYFEETYQCLKNQTFQDFEWIIVDDGSTEPNAIDLFSSLTQRSLKIKTIYHNLNHGIATGRNTAISQASGKYLFFMDLDDLIDPTYIEKCVLFLETHPEFSFVNSYCVGFQQQEYWWNHGFQQTSAFIQHNWVTVMLMYRKADFDKLGGFDENLRFYEDWERWLKAIVNHQKGWTIPEYLHCYRRNNSRLFLTSRGDATRERQVIELIQSRYQEFFVKNQFSNLELKKISAFDADFKTFQVPFKNKLENQISGKRILCFFPHLEVGGADKFNLDLISLLADRGYDITIATTLKSEHSWHQHFYAVTPNIFHLANFLHETHWLTFARYIIESRQIDVVYISNSYIAYYLLPFLRKEFPHVAFVDYVHCDDPGWRQCGYPRVSCQFSQLLDCQIVSSKWLAEFYQKLKPDTKPKLRVCYTNEDVDKWTPSYEKRTALRSQLKISDDTVVLLFPARIVPQKRPFFVVDIVRELAKKSLKVVVICLGQGYLLPEMQAKIEQLGLQQFFLILPPVQPEQMVDFYSASDILLLPTEYEGISLAIYEAMSMKLSVVASNVGGQSELVIPGTGFLIDKGKGDADELQAYLEVLVPSIQNPELRDKIGFSARQRIAEYFSLDAMVDRMESIFAEAITLRKSDLDVEVNLSIAEELLVFVLEHTSQEKLLEIIWREKCHIEQEKHRIEQEKCHIEHERNTLWHRKNAMETSKFWKIRRLWFKIKQKLGLTQEEP